MRVQRASIRQEVAQGGVGFVRSDDAQRNPLIAGAQPIGACHLLPAEAEDAARACAGRDGQVDRAGEGG